MPPANRAAAVAEPGVFLPQPQSETPIAGAERTSVAARHHSPDEVTVRFVKWHPHGNTAYQRGSFAGFRRDVAMRLVAGGVAVVAETAEQRRDAADRFMVTK